jgi:hypothetical protein
MRRSGPALHAAGLPRHATAVFVRAQKHLSLLRSVRRTSGIAVRISGIRPSTHGSLSHGDSL